MKAFVRWTMLTVFFLATLLWVRQATEVDAQTQVGTGFTYQGRLSDGDNPASGDYDFRFKLYTAATAGSQVGSSFSVGNVTVADGFFTVTLDFGDNIFNGEARYLEIEVREAGETDYTTLAPRQPLTAVPYALHALSGSGSDTLAGLTCAANEIAVWNGSAWVCGSNGGGSHNHLGQTWTGTNPLQIDGSYNDAPLVLSNSTEQGLSITSAGGTGVLVNKAGNASTTTATLTNNGFEVQGAEGHGLQVGQSDMDGVHVTKANSDGVRIERADSNGLQVDSSGGPGILIDEAGSNGIRINKAGTPSTSNFSLNFDGVSIHGAEGNGVYVGHSDLSGVLIKSAAEDGITIEDAGLHGVFVNKAAGVGFGVSDATGSGLYIGKTGASGIYIDDAGDDGIYINGATANGVDVTTNGSASTIYAQNSGSGRGLSVVSGSGTGVNISTGSSNAVNATNNSSYAAVYAKNNGSGDGISVETGSGNAVEATNNSSLATVYADNNGSGTGVWADTGSGTAVVANASSGTAVYANTSSGTAGSFISDSGSNILVAADRASSNSVFTRFRVTLSGDIRADGSYYSGTGNYLSGFADFAELLPADAGLTPGDVLIIGDDGKLTHSTEANAANVAGVYSTQPGFVGGFDMGNAEEFDSVNDEAANDFDKIYAETGKVPLAVVGIVPVKVSTENGDIHPGDLLTTSTIPGHAMRATPVSLEGIELHRPGTIIGKALEPLTTETGVIKVLVTLQ